MDTNALIKPIYGGRNNYGEIARDAASQKLSEHDLLVYLEEKYSADPTVCMSNSAPFNIFGKDIIAQNAIDQMIKTCSIPPAIRGALMPDAHKGYAMPIGGVVALEDAISASYVGYDISCMMRASILNLSPQELMRNRGYYAAVLEGSTSFGLGASTLDLDHPVMDDDDWDRVNIVKQYKSLAASQLGSSGGGNHFANLMTVFYEDGTVGTCILTHSGSRGTGYKIAEYYMQQMRRNLPYGHKIEKGYEWADINSSLGAEYLVAMELMGRYALANHELIHNQFAEKAQLSIEKSIYNRHNYAWVTEEGVIHRKGATPSNQGEIGIIPGSCGTKSYIVSGMGNPDSLYSSSHGAGRIHSSSDAEKAYKENEFRQYMQDKNILHIGIAPYETHRAYKDIDDVMQGQLELVDIVAMLMPSVTIMGGKSDDGD